MNFVRDFHTYVVAFTLVAVIVFFCGALNASIGKFDREFCTLLQTLWVFASGMLSMYGLAGFYDYSEQNVVAQSD